MDPYGISAALERLTRLLRRLSQPSDLSFPAAATLSTLERTGPGRLTGLAALEGVSQPAMTQLVSRLEKAGLVNRRPSADGDRRVVLVELTDAGRARLAERRALRVERLAGLLEQLPPDQLAALEAAMPAVDELTRLAPGPSDSEKSDSEKSVPEKSAAESSIPESSEHSANPVPETPEGPAPETPVPPKGEPA